MAPAKWIAKILEWHEATLPLSFKECQYSHKHVWTHYWLVQYSQNIFQMISSPFLAMSFLWSIAAPNWPMPAHSQCISFLRSPMCSSCWAQFLQCRAEDEALLWQAALAQCPFLPNEGSGKASFIIVNPLESESYPRYFLAPRYLAMLQGKCEARSTSEMTMYVHFS